VQADCTQKNNTFSGIRTTGIADLRYHSCTVRYGTVQSWTFGPIDYCGSALSLSLSHSARLVDLTLIHPGDRTFPASPSCIFLCTLLYPQTVLRALHSSIHPSSSPYHRRTQSHSPPPQKTPRPITDWRQPHSTDEGLRARSTTNHQHNPPPVHHPLALAHEAFCASAFCPTSFGRRIRRIIRRPPPTLALSQLTPQRAKTKGIPSVLVAHTGFRCPALSRHRTVQGVAL
jgi:hypothetical protein